MHIVDKVKILLLHPASFFTHLKKEKGVKEAFQLQAIISLFGIAIPMILILLFPSLQEKLIEKTLYFSGEALTAFFLQPHILPFVAAFNYGFGLLFTFVSAALFFVWLKIFGGQLPYPKAYQLSIYGAAPSTLLGWIPGINFFASVYSFFLLWKGTAIMYGFSTKRILIMYLVVPLLVLAVLLGLAAVAGISLLQPTP